MVWGSFFFLSFFLSFFFFRGKFASRVGKLKKVCSCNQKTHRFYNELCQQCRVFHATLRWWWIFIVGFAMYNMTCGEGMLLALIFRSELFKVCQFLHFEHFLRSFFFFFNEIVGTCLNLWNSCIFRFWCVDKKWKK